MSNDIAPLATVQENIKAKIKAEFVNLIPDEMWAAMVTSVVTEFVTDVRDRYDNKVTPSPLKGMIRDEITALAKAKLKDELDVLGRGAWNTCGHQVAGEAIKNLIAEHFPALLVSVQQSMIEMTVQTAVAHLRNSMFNR